MVTGAAELRVKETDRIAAMAKNLRRAGVPVEEIPDGMTITGVPTLAGCQAESFGDHRIAMSMLVAGLAATGETSVDDTECIATSFPGFLELLNAVASH